VAQRNKNRAVNLDKKQGMQLRRFNAPGNARPGVDLPDCAAHYNHMAFYFSRGSCDDDFVVGSRSLIWTVCSQMGYGPVYGGLAARYSAS